MMILKKTFLYQLLSGQLLPPLAHLNTPGTFGGIRDKLASRLNLKKAGQRLKTVTARKIRDICSPQYIQKYK